MTVLKQDRRRQFILQALENLRGFYDCLHDPRLAERLCERLPVPDTGNDQSDYESVRLQLERRARKHETY